MSKHTPGPWEIDSGMRTAINKGGKHVAMVSFYKDGTPNSVDEIEHEANARLIAAAPEMLEALKAVRAADDTHRLAEIPGMPRIVRIVVDAAIAKAEGPQ